MKQKFSLILMIVAILGITGFQGYWLKNNYDREKQNLDIKTASLFKQTILRLQASKLKLERFNVNVDSVRTGNVSYSKRNNSRKNPVRRQDHGEPPISILNLIQEKMKDSILRKPGSFMIQMTGDSSNRILIDSLSRLRGGIRSVRLDRKLDSVFNIPGKFDMVRVEKGVDSAGNSITINYGNRITTTEKTNIVVGPEFSENHKIVLPEMPGRRGDSLITTQFGVPKRSEIFQFLYNVDSLSLKDSVTVKEIDSAYSNALNEENIKVDFAVQRLDTLDTPPSNAVTIGFSKPASFVYKLDSTFAYMFDQLKLPILFSILLVGITLASFVLLYRNMLRQKRLAELKNEFISNITHELKTPIATVGVAIEAIKNFNAMDNPARTREYLDISQNELQRLNLLVDKVLKLSMFEKKEIELKYEYVNLLDIINEVTTSMRLQLEKYHAVVNINTEGDTHVQADRLHMLSVIFNLVDNALKYGKDPVEININLEEKETLLVLTFADNGIGFSPEYREKIFEKFFRIPHGDTHNAKGYGLGLSYVAHVIKKHRGTITVDSLPGKGATFVISLPKQQK
jgi:two-component system phosphate regulon sensor histidine kinase PhoR